MLPRCASCDWGQLWSTEHLRTRAKQIINWKYQSRDIKDNLTQELGAQKHIKHKQALFE